jgi:hypothetical protein
MKRIEATSIFALAGIEVLNIKPLIDGYGYSPEDPRFYEQPPRCAWWFVKTKMGWIEIGWRKRVININWEDTPIRRIVTNDNVTRGETHVHADNNMKAVEYLTALAKEFKDIEAQVAESVA